MQHTNICKFNQFRLCSFCGILLVVLKEKQLRKEMDLTQSLQSMISTFEEDQTIEIPSSQFAEVMY
jgi:hypothetical protein